MQNCSKLFVSNCSNPKMSKIPMYRSFWWALWGDIKHELMRFTTQLKTCSYKDLLTASRLSIALDTLTFFVTVSWPPLSPGTVMLLLHNASAASLGSIASKRHAVSRGKFPSLRRKASWFSAQQRIKLLQHPVTNHVATAQGTTFKTVIT